MNTQQDVIEIFSAFHDGCIEEAAEKPGLLILKISCQYLAALIEENFEYFYLHIGDISKLQLLCWMEEPKIITEIARIFDPELEILTAKQEGEDVLISCSVEDQSGGYSGGDLILNCGGISLYDQNQQALSIERLKMICGQYWAAFGSA